MTHDIDPATRICRGCLRPLWQIEASIHPVACKTDLRTPSAAHSSTHLAAATGSANAADFLTRAHAALMAALATPVPPIPLHTEPVDFTSRGMHARLILSCTREYLMALANDAIDNSCGGIDGAELTETIDAHLSDLADEIDGTFAKEAERLYEDRYDGCSRGPMARARP